MFIRLVFVSILVLQSFFSLYSQNRFEFAKKDQNYDRVKFQLINNLVLIPVKVNEVELTFLLDTGSASTVIFSFEETDSLLLKNSSIVTLRGLGNQEPVEAIKSELNTIQIANAVKKNQTIFVVFDGALSFSSRLGVPVHGIIGSDFLRDFVVEVNNNTKILRFYNVDAYQKKRGKKWVEIPLFFINEKPHLAGNYKNNTVDKLIHLLIDSGSGDGLWLFEDEEQEIIVPQNAFEDYLGLGINGNIYGKRSKIESFILDRFKFTQVNSAYPDVEDLKQLGVFSNRNGSLGGEILKRFNWTIDYSNKKLILGKSKYYHMPFHYNMSGITLQHGSFALYSQRRAVDPDTYKLNQSKTLNVFSLNLSSNFDVRLEQVYEVIAIRGGSPAEKAGLQIGDEILEVNHVPAYKYTLNEINQLFYVKEGKRIKMLISRNGIKHKVDFELKDL